MVAKIRLLIARTRVIDPAQREIAVGKVLASGPGIEPPLAFVGAPGSGTPSGGDPLGAPGP